MYRKYIIGGSATINGIIMINPVKGIAVKATINRNGEICVKELAAYSKAIEFYNSKVERYISKIPAIRDLYRILLMMVLVIFSLISDVLRMFSLKKICSIKGIINVLFCALAIFVFVFLEDYFSIIMLVILVFYFRKEIATILRYHGAEHKCINMYENSESIEYLSTEYARKYSRIHSRCGTNIISLLIPLSIMYYLFLEKYFLSMEAGGILDFLGSLVLLGIAIELLKQFQKPPMKWIFKVGSFIQYNITTKEPEDNHLDVAMAALKGVIAP
jgi:uncharacterized protein YqhQ